MTIYTFPDTLLHSSSTLFALRSLTAMSPQSAFNQYSATSGPVTEFWRVTVSLVPGDADTYRIIRALLHQLRGGKNIIRLFDPTSHPMRGAGASSPTVNIATDAAAGAETIVIKNMTASQTGSLKADDKIGIGENLYTVMADANSNGSGEVSVDILPALRQGVAEGDPVNLVMPTGLFRLMSSPDMVIVPGNLSQPLSLEFVEDPDFG